MPITFGLGKKLIVAQFGHASGIGDVNKPHRFVKVTFSRVLRHAKHGFSGRLFPFSDYERDVKFEVLGFNPVRFKYVEFCILEISKL